MAKVKEDISRVRLIVDGKQGINELGKLEMEAKQLAIDIKNAKKGTDEYVNASKRLKETRAQITEVRKELGITGMTLGQLTRYQRELRREMQNTTTRGTQEYRRLRAELDKVNAAVRTQRAELNGTKGFFAGMGRELKAFGVMAVGALGATAFFSQIQSMIDGSAKLSDALSDVQKTTNLTDMELDRLAKNLKTFDTRTPRSELLGLAEVAGRLGIKGVKDIEGFVRAADMINVSLGDVLGDPEAVMRDLGKLTDTFGIQAAYGIEESLLRVGSAINELGMASTANEGYMVEFAKRMGGIAPLAKITIEDILGLGATLDSLGQTSEVSTTALSKLFISMAKNADVYAKYARMEVNDFVKLLNEDANEAFIRSLEGVQDNSAGITELTATLGDLGESGGRVVGVLGTLASNTDKLRAQQELATKAFAEGSSVVDEFAIKNENFAANLEKVQKWLAQLFVNSAIMNGLDRFVSLWADWIRIPVSETIEAERIELNKMYLQIISTNTSTEDRIRLINELKTAYPDYLGQIDADKVSNEGLAGAIKMVNDQLLNKIILQKQDEEITAQSERVAEQRMDVFEREGKIRAQMIALAEKHNLTIKEGMTLQEQAYDIIGRAEQFYAGSGNAMLDNVFDPVQKLKSEVLQLGHNYRVLNSMEEENNALLDEKKKLMDRLGIVEGGTPPPIVPPTPDAELDPDDDPDSDPSGVPGDPDAAQKKLDELAAKWEAYQQKIRQLTREYELSGMEGEERELAQLQDKYTALEDQLAQHLANKAITEQQYREQAKVLQDLQQQEEAAITQKYADKEAEARVNAEQKIREATSEEKELALLKTEEHYDQLTALAKKYGLDTVAIEEARKKAILDLQSKYDAKDVQAAKDIAEAKIMIAQGLSAALGGMIDIVGTKTGEMTAFQKVLTASQIAMDTASALGKIVPLALEAASGTGPAAPFVFAGYLASMGGVVLSAIGRAKKALAGSQVPQWNSSESDSPQSSRSRESPSTPAPVKSFYQGGDTSGTGLGIGDRYGEFTGYVHKDEYVIPSFIRSHPYVADVLPAIEAIRKDRVRGFYKGGDTGDTPKHSASVPPTNPNQRLEQLMEKMIDKMDAMPTRIKAYLVDSELEEFRDKRDMLKKKYVK